MIRLLMASTAIAAILATSTIAQDASSSAAMDTTSSSSMMSSSSAPADMSSSSAPADMSSSAAPTDMSSSAAPADGNTTTTVTPRQPVQIISGYTRADTDNLATTIIGRPVYDGTGTDANNLGTVNDLVVNQNGEVSAVILGVGGFLGIGQKQVAVDFKALQWVVAADNTERYVLQTTKDELTQAPDFVTVDDQPGDANANGGNPNATGDNSATANGNSATGNTASDNMNATSTPVDAGASSSSSSAAQ